MSLHGSILGFYGSVVNPHVPGILCEPQRLHVSLHGSMWACTAPLWACTAPLWASTLRLHCEPPQFNYKLTRLSCESLQLPPFHLNVDLDDRDPDLDFTLTRIRIQLPKIMGIWIRNTAFQCAAFRCHNPLLHTGSVLDSVMDPDPKICQLFSLNFLSREQ